MLTCVSLWVCTCGDVGGGWDVHVCVHVVVWVVVWDVYMCEFVGVYMW